jgi:hypothetical protein
MLLEYFRRRGSTKIVADRQTGCSEPGAVFEHRRVAKRNKYVDLLPIRSRRPSIGIPVRSASAIDVC